MASSPPSTSLGYNAPIITIPIATYQAITITFCAIAIIAAAVRSYIRISKGQQHFLDDYILLPFACATLIASTALSNISAPPLHQLVVASYVEMVDPAALANIPMSNTIVVHDKVQSYGYPFGALI